MKSTFSRIFYSVAVIMLLTILILGASFRTMVKQYLEDRTTQQLKSNAQTIAELAALYAEQVGMYDMGFLSNVAVASRVTGSDVMICDSLGKITLCTDNPLTCPHIGMYINGEYMQKVQENGMDLSVGQFPRLYEEKRFLVAVPISGQTGENLGLVLVSVPAASTQVVMGRITDIFVFLALVVIALAGVLTAILTRRQSKPLQDMARAATAFGHGDLSARVQVSRDCPTEVEELAIAFNNMASSLEKSEYQRQEFVANVSHELKTPMTTISGYVDGVLDGTIPPERASHYLQIVSEETKRLSRLVRSMLDISRLQDEPIPEEKKTRFDMEECVGQVLITFERKILDKHLDVDVQMPEHPLYTRASQDAVTQVVYNLLDNAVKFCPEGGRLGLHLREAGNKIYTSISNEGETIPPEELPLVFDRFHKIDKSRSQNRDGWGLGLYIVRTIVCSHGENISVTSRDGKTEFTFTMPVSV